MRCADLDALRATTRKDERFGECPLNIPLVSYKSPGLRRLGNKDDDRMDATQPEDRNIVLVNSVTVRKTEELIMGCHC
jgi:hypothetical protein